MCCVLCRVLRALLCCAVLCTRTVLCSAVCCVLCCAVLCAVTLYAVCLRVMYRPPSHGAARSADSHRSVGAVYSARLAVSSWDRCELFLPLVGR